MQAGRDSQDPASRDRAVLRSELVGSVALLPLLRLLPLGVTCITPQADRHFIHSTSRYRIQTWTVARDCVHRYLTM